jgi:PadR family transcriptional regulator PadR
MISSMAQTTPQTPGRQAMDYTDRAYWNGLIKMSLSKFFILCVLQTQPMHGYEITRAVERTTNGCCSPAEGTIYPVLREFEQGGYVTAHTEVNARSMRSPSAGVPHFRSPWRPGWRSRSAWSGTSV